MTNKIVPEILNEKTFDRLADYVRLKGNPAGADVKSEGNSGDYDSCSNSENKKIKSLKLDNIEIRLTKRKIRDSYSDSMVSSWSKTKERTLEFLEKGKLLFNVYQFLGGKEKSGGRGFRRREEKLDSEPWKLKEVHYTQKIPDLIARIDEAYKAYR